LAYGSRIASVTSRTCPSLIDVSKGRAFHAIPSRIAALNMLAHIMLVSIRQALQPARPFHAWFLMRLLWQTVPKKPFSTSPANYSAGENERFH